MVLDEIVQKVIADDLAAGCALIAEGSCDKVQIFLQRIRAVHHPDEFHQTAHDVVREVFLIGDGDAVVRIREERLIPARVPFAARVGKALRVQRIAAEHAANGVGEQRDDLIPQGAHIGAALHTFRHVVLCAENPMDRNVLVGHLGGQLVLQAVDADEDAVQLLLVGLELLEAGFTFRLPGGEFIGDLGAHYS